MNRQPEPELMDERAEAEAYAKADFSSVNQAFVDRAVELAGPLAQASVVDLGTGPADIPLRLHKSRPRWKIAAVDASAAMLKLAAASVQAAGAGTAIRLVLADAKSTPLPAGQFDLVMSNSIIHHVKDISAFWDEVKRLARPGAIVFHRDLARPSDEEAARGVVQANAGQESATLQEEFYRSLLAAYTIEEVKQQLAERGLTGLNVEMSSDRHWDVWGGVGGV